MSTNKYGGRTLGEQNLSEKILAFGESQLLGLDFSEPKEGTQHDLSLLFPSSSITIYAAPNNGPLQAIRQMQRIHSTEPLNGKKIIVGFNYGTDIFRIQSHWKPEAFVPLNMQQLKHAFMIPGYFDLMLFLARVRGVKFGSTVSNSEAIRRLYNQIDDSQRTQDIKNWLYKLSESEIRLGKTLSFVLYPPYWYVGAKKQEKNKIESDYHKFACKTYKAGIFDVIFMADLPKNKVKLAADNRHFLSGEMNFRQYSC